jgi:surfeit locus 1 family protein
VVAFRNTHLVYALTWFALAGLGAWGLWRVVRER